MPNLSDTQYTVLVNIPYGKKNALKTSDIASSIGQSDRYVKQIVQELREKGYPIISSCTGGYFLPVRGSDDDIREAERFCKMQFKQASSRYESAKPVKQWLNNVNQLSIACE